MKSPPLSFICIHLFPPHTTLAVSGIFYELSVSHINLLISEFSKDKHLLTLSDLKPDDKMNFAAAEKICDPCVLDLLAKIPDSRGTVYFLRLMNF